MILCALFLCCQDPLVTIELPATTDVVGHSIELGEIAVIRSDDAAVVAALEAIDLGYSPSPGYTRLIFSEKVAESVRLAYPGLVFQMTGAQACKIAPRTERIASARLEQAAREALQLAAGEDRVTIELQQPILDVDVPLGAEAAVIRAVPSTGEVRTGTQAVSLKVEVDGRPYVTRQALFTVQRWQNVAVLKRRIATGAAITPDLVELREVVLPAHQREKPLTTSMMIGAVAARDLEFGRAIFSLDVHRPVAVQSQSPIILEVRHGGITARAAAIAMDAGAIGDRIRVRIADSGREMHAFIQARDLVVIDLGAPRVTVQ